MKIGYARVSTNEQKTHRQTDQLEGAGCEKIYIDVCSGKKSSRPELDKMLAQLREGDLVVVTRLARLGRNMKDMIKLSERLTEKKVELKSLKEDIDTKTATGKLMFHLFAVLAEFERDLIVQRTNEGLIAARARGRKGGRPKGLTAKSKEEAKLIYILHTSPEYKNHSIQQLMDIVKVNNKSTFYNRLNWAKANLPEILPQQKKPK